MTAYWQSQRHRDYHLRQYQEPYRSTVALADFVTRIAPTLTGRAVDVGCGAGANIYHLSRALSVLEWWGIDLAFLDEARSRLPEVQFVEADFYKLSGLGERFDVVFSIQTLSWLPAYEDALAELIGATVPGGWLFITSLFTDSSAEAVTTVRLPGGGESPYNVYSLERFQAECERRRAQVVAAEDFLIDVDLEAPTDRGMGTYTRRLEDGSRLQFSGPLWMPWKFVAVRKMAE